MNRHLKTLGHPLRGPAPAPLASRHILTTALLVAQVATAPCCALLARRAAPLLEFHHHLTRLHVVAGLELHGGHLA
jgi:hypothetical protein